jgi:hypothetical protein
MKKKYLYAMMVVLVVCGVSDAMKPITDFKTADEFGLRMMEISEPRNAPKEVENAFEGIVELSVSNELKIGLIEKIKDDLSNEFPFITEMAKTYIQKIAGSNLYEAGKEAELGKMLLRSQNDSILCLDIILKAVRLLRRFDPDGAFKTVVYPFMEKNKLRSYL